MVNKGLPYVMHIDLNSCFAIIEQQANRLLRKRPVGIAAYDTPRGFVLAASYEAKAKGVKLGVNVAQARALAPGIVIMTPDPAKYRKAHKLFREVLLEYTPDVVPKSIDEFVLDMNHSPALRNTKALVRNEISETKSHESRDKSQEMATRISAATHDSRLLTLDSDLDERTIHNEAMERVGFEIKQKIRQRLGEWVTVNIGIGPNRFLAKYAAGFDKPDGMTLIDHANLRSRYENMKLVNLPGINTRYRARLRAAGIYTPLEFLDADMNKLKKRVFKSINGYHWYMRLRGYEADAVEFKQKSIGHQHALSNKTTDMAELERLLMKLSEKIGRRLRKGNYYASGVHLYLGFASDTPQLDGPLGFDAIHRLKSWHHGEKVHYRLYSTQDIYKAAKKLLHSADIAGKVNIMSVHVYDLHPWDPVQTSLFDQNEDWGLKIGDSPYRRHEAQKRISDAVDELNNRYGEFVLTPALMIEMQGTILDRIAFGSVRDF